MKNDDTRVGENPRTTIIEPDTFAVGTDSAPSVESLGLLELLIGAVEVEESEDCRESIQAGPM